MMRFVEKQVMFSESLGMFGEKQRWFLEKTRWFAEKCNLNYAVTLFNTFVTTGKFPPFFIQIK